MRGLREHCSRSHASPGASTSMMRARCASLRAANCGCAAPAARTASETVEKTPSPDTGPATAIPAASAAATSLSLLIFLAPAGVGWLSENYLHWNAWWSNLLEGIIRLIFLLGYMWGIGFAKDIARVFAYHGAEHKTINAFEAGRELTPTSVARFSIEHPRCGTAFLLTLMVLSLFSSRRSAAPHWMAAHQQGGDDPRPGRYRLRVLALDRQPSKLDVCPDDGKTQPGLTTFDHTRTGREDA